MAYNRKGTADEVLAGTEADVLVTPLLLKQNVWYFDGNTVSAEKDFGTTNNFDVPIIRNSVEKIRIDDVTWTTNNYISNVKIGVNGSQSVMRFPVNSAVQHGIVNTIDGSLLFIIANGETSGSTVSATPLNITSTGLVGIGNTPSTNLDVTGGLRFRTFGTTGNLLSVTDSNGNITSVSPSTIVANGNGFIQNGNSFGVLGILGTNDSFGLSIETTNTEAIRIDTLQNVGVGTNNPQTRLHLNNGIFRQEQISVITQQNVHANTDVDSAATQVVATVPSATFAAAFFDYVIYDGSKTNMRCGTLRTVWNSSTIEYEETSTLDIGNTAGVTLSAAINGASIELRATVTTDNWTVKAISRTLS